MTESYVELHSRSAFSFLEGASLPEALMVRAGKFEIPAMALLDRDSLSGAVRFHKAAEKAKVRALVGVEVTAREGFRYPLIAETHRGYQNLCRLISKIKLREANGEQDKAAASLEDIAAHAEGVVCLTGGDEGPLAFELRGGEDQLRKIVGIFGQRNVYVELQRHRQRDEERRNQAAIQFAQRLHLPLLATNGVCHATPGDRELMDVLTCTRHKTTIAEAGRLLAKNSHRHIKPPSEMTRLFADIPEAIANTRELGSRITYTLADLGYKFPAYPVPEGQTMNSFLRQLAVDGAHQRYQHYEGRVRTQIERELALIEKLDLAGYFLIVWDIVRFCAEKNILVQGRGSAANSAVCYALRITAVDPIGMDLLFERFLSENREEWPDIDLDLPSGDQREKAIQYVYERYGRLGAAMTANVITYRGRSAARDVGKALGFEPEVLARLSKFAPMWGFRDEKDTAERQFRDADIDLTQPAVQNFLSLYEAIQDLPRHLGQHSGGMVICQGRLDAVVPLQPATMPGRVIVQWDKEDCADMRIVKVDLLGLGMMAVLEDSIALIDEHHHEHLDLGKLPPNDKKVYAALQRADTVGLFQVESRAQMASLPRMRPEKFYDLVVQVAIIRPGPIEGKMAHPYLARRQGKEKAEPLHPSLDDILERTLGVPLFQEQLLRMAMRAADFTGGEAEELRRAFGFKRSEKRMKEIEVKLRAGMTKKDITGETQEKIVKAITSFAMFGFPESHAASFALLAYASAYLRTYYLAAFTCAMLNNQPMGFYQPLTLVKDAQRHGLHFKSVDIMQSQWRCTMEEHAGEKCVRLGFNYVKGLHESTAHAMVAARQDSPFTSVRDVARRVSPLNKTQLNRLAAIGALNFQLGANHRRDALWQSELAIRPVTELLEPAAYTQEPSPLAPMDPLERIHADFYNTGLSIGRHPMSFHRQQMDAIGVVSATNLSAIQNGRWVSIAGCVICRQRPGTAKGFVFISLEDETGIANAIVEPGLFDLERTTVVDSSYLRIDGVLQNQEGVVCVRARRVHALDTSLAQVESHDFR